MQQTVNMDPSAGHSASPSMLSQKSADSTFVHFPLHGFSGNVGLVVIVIVDDCLVVIVGVVVVNVVIIVAMAVAEASVNDIFDFIVVDGDEASLKTPLPFFSSKREEFIRSITKSSGGGKSPKASLDTQHL